MSCSSIPSIPTCNRFLVSRQSVSEVFFVALFWPEFTFVYLSGTVGHSSHVQKSWIGVCTLSAASEELPTFLQNKDLSSRRHRCSWKELRPICQKKMCNEKKLWVLACWQSRFHEVRQLYSKLFRFWNSSITSQSGLGLPKLVCAGLKPEGQRNSVLGSPDMYTHEKKNPGKIYDLLNIQNECSTARRFSIFIATFRSSLLGKMQNYCRCG